MADLNIALEIAGHAQGALSAVTSVDKALDSLQSSGGKAQGFFSGLIGTLGGLGLAAQGVTAIGGAIAGVATSMVSGNAEMETYETQFGTLLGSVDKAKDRLKDLAEFGARTPFELPEIARAEKVLVGFGLTGEKALKMTGQSAEDFRTTVGDIAAGTGASFEEIALNMGKFSAGATGEAIARFQEMGIVTKEQLAAMGVQFSKSGELLSPLPTAMQAIVTAANQKFGGGMDKLSATFSGQMSTLSDGINQAKTAIMQPIFNVLRDSLASANSFIASGKFQEGLKQVADILANGVANAIEIAKTAFTTFLELGTRVQTFFSSLGEFGSVAQAVNAAFGDLIPPELNPILDLIDAGFTRIKTTVEGFITAFREGGLAGLWAQLSESMSALAPTGEAVGRIFNTIAEAVRQLVPQPIQDFVSNLIAASKGAGDGVDVFGTLATVLNTVSTALAEVVGFVKENVAAQTALVGILGAVATAWAISTAVNAYTTAVELAGVAVKAYTAVQTALNVVLSANPIGIVVIALGALAAALIFAYKNSDTFREVVDNAFSVIKDVVLGAMQAAQVAIDLFVATLRTASSVANTTYNAIRTAFDSIGSTVESVTSTISNTISDAWNGIKNTVTSRMADVNTAITTGWNTSEDIITTANNAIRSKINEVWDALPADIREDLTLIYNDISRRWEEVQTAISSALDSIQGESQSTWSQIQSNISSALNTISNVVRQKWAEVSTTVTGAMETIRASVVEAWNTITEAVSSAMETIIAVVGPAWESVRTAIVDAVNTGREAAVAAFEAIRAAVEEKTAAALELVNSWGGSVLKFLGGMRDTVLGLAQGIGGAIIEGIKIGLGNGWDALKEYAMQLARSLLQAAKDSLGIKSPSAEFMEVGEEIVNGLVAGIRSNQPLALSTVTTMGLMLVSHAKAVLPEGFTSVGGVIVRNIAKGVKDNTPDILQAIDDLKTGSEGALGAFNDWMQGELADWAAHRTELLKRFNYAAYLRGEGTKMIPELKAVVEDYEANVRRAFTAAAEALSSIASNLQSAILEARRETEQQVIAAVEAASSQIEKLMEQRDLNRMLQAQRDAFARAQEIQRNAYERGQQILEDALKKQEDTARIHYTTMQQLQNIAVADERAFNGPVAVAQRALDTQTQLARINFEESRDLGRAKTEDEKAEIKARAEEARQGLQDQLDEERAVWEATKEFRLTLQRETILEQQRAQLQALEDAKNLELNVAAATMELRNELTNRQAIYERMVAQQTEDFEKLLADQALQRQIDNINKERDERIRGLNEALAEKERQLEADAEKERQKALEQLHTRLEDYKTEFISKIQQAFRNAQVDLADFIHDITGEMTDQVNTLNGAIEEIMRKIAEARQKVGETPTFVAVPDPRSNMPNTAPNTTTPSALPVPNELVIGAMPNELRRGLPNQTVNQFNLQVNNNGGPMNEGELANVLGRMRLLAG